jgi:Protein of unknown function (DUF3224)
MPAGIPTSALIESGDLDLGGVRNSHAGHVEGVANLQSGIDASGRQWCIAGHQRNEEQMSTHVEATFEISSWDESPFDDGVGVSKLTEAVVTKRYSGAIAGTSTTKWLMAYAPDKTATYVGVERLQGTIGGRRGTLVLLHDGTFEDGVATAALRAVVGTDQLKDVTGTGTFTADPSGVVELDLAGI